MSSQLNEYCSIYYFIKATNPSLHKLIKDSCLKKVFGYRFITFLMPNTSLINKMKKEKPSVVAKMLKGLILKGIYKNQKELTGDVNNFLNGQLEKSSELKVKVDPKFIQWDGYDNLSVLLYDGSDVPSAKESKPKIKSEVKIINKLKK